MRRYESSSRGRAWSGARARRDADRFFADLMGVRPRVRAQPVYEDPGVYESVSRETAATYEPVEDHEDEEHEHASEIDDAYEDVHGPELAPESEHEEMQDVALEADALEDDALEDDALEDDALEDDETSADGFAYDAEDDEDDEDDESADAWEEP